MRRQGGASTLLAGQALTRGAGGAVSRISTYDSSAAFVAGTGSFSGDPVRVQSFGYDANARLTSERDYKGAQLAAFLGNRTAKTVTTATGSTVTTTYTWDGNGNLASKSSPGEYIGRTSYVFLDGVTGLPCVAQTTQGVDSRLQQHKEEGKRALKQVLARFEVVAERTSPP